MESPSNNSIAALDPIPSDLEYYIINTDLIPNKQATILVLLFTGAI